MAKNLPHTKTFFIPPGTLDPVLFFDVVAGRRRVAAREEVLTLLAESRAGGTAARGTRIEQRGERRVRTQCGRMTLPVYARYRLPAALGEGFRPSPPCPEVRTTHKTRGNGRKVSVHGYRKILGCAYYAFLDELASGSRRAQKILEEWKSLRHGSG